MVAPLIAPSAERWTAIEPLLDGALDLAPEDRGDEVRALREMPVDRGHSDARARGDVADRGVDARLGEDGLGGLEQRVEVALRVGAHGARGRGRLARRYGGFAGRRRLRLGLLEMLRSFHGETVSSPILRSGRPLDKRNGDPYFDR